MSKPAAKNGQIPQINFISRREMYISPAEMYIPAAEMYISRREMKFTTNVEQVNIGTNAILGRV
ncbi:hypothetical protein [Bacteroides sp.]|uniref:hypothetical protein n=1 Tax=Bacteroides sp. TaxID=29523 RepID=UPI0023D5180A|nr:hypothetical protein [Bacteroides sp.]MDE5760788.1 hypothetical protein [Bacteroides sp.]MDE6215179.1 hypothetical protein [Bacteroides sp.]